MENGTKILTDRHIVFGKPGNISKIEQYGWRLADTPGELIWIDKHDILIDRTYQRDLVSSKVTAISADWSWLACGVLLVGRRNGKYFAYDGSHRHAAAMQRSDIQKLPCLVFESIGADAEAKGFIAANTLRKPIDSLDRYRAHLVAGDPIALKVERLLKDSGYEPARAIGTGRKIKCLTLLRKMVSENEEMLRRCWPLVLEVADGGPISERLIETVVFIEGKLAKMRGGLDAAGDSLLKSPWRDRLVRLGPDGVNDATVKATAYYAKGGARIWSFGVVDALNRGVRNRLSIGEAAQADPHDEQ